jgi:hypothetical protein
MVLPFHAGYSSVVAMQFSSIGILEADRSACKFADAIQIAPKGVYSSNNDQQGGFLDRQTWSISLRMQIPSE